MTIKDNHPAKVISVQTLLYEASSDIIYKFFECLASCEVPDGYKLSLYIGDCSRQPNIDQDFINHWGKVFNQKKVNFSYRFFNQNLGFAKGHNTLYRETPESDLLLILNPDAVFPFHLIRRLVSFAEKHPDFGLVEARQIPLEHPKEFDLNTGEVSWASGACSLFRSQAFKECNGFDEIFFMYCEDVDLSWRIRANNYKIYYCLDTFIYHSKNMTGAANEQSETEKYYGPLSALLLRAKYGKGNINKVVLEWLKNNNEPLYTKLVDDYQSKLKLLIPATPAQRKKAFFGDDGNFAVHRWAY